MAVQFVVDPVAVGVVPAQEPVDLSPINQVV